MSTDTPSRPGGGLLDRLRQPEYTGENRCTPCTILNVVIAAVVAGGLSIVATPVGIGFLALALVTIYFRGYLIPGTPTFTKQYFPERVLRWFDKAEASTNEAAIADPEDDGENKETAASEELSASDAPEDIEPERILADAGAIMECADRNDVCLAPDFQDAWRDQIVDLREELSIRTNLADVLDVEEDRVTVRDAGGSFVAEFDGVRGIEWPSHAAYLADVAAGQVFNRRYEAWDDLDAPQRVTVLNALRLFIEYCPECDGEVSIGEEVVKSCCRSFDVVAVTCDSCKTRLFELQDPDIPQEGGDTASAET